jgi:parallel beta-helix repeat protein
MRFNLFLLFLIVPFLCGATYYVATDGSGNFTTIAQVNSASFSKGDNVLFKRGDVFSGILNITWDGVIIDAYGYGNTPILRRINSVIGVGNYSVSNISIEQNVWGNAVNIIGGINIVFDNLTVEDLGYGGSAAVMNMEGNSTFGWVENITIKNSEFMNGLNTTGLSVDEMCRNISVVNCSAHGNGDNNFQVFNGYAERNILFAPHNITFINCIGYGAKNHGLELGWDANNCTVRNSYFYENGLLGLIFVDANNNTAENNLFINNTRNIGFFGEGLPTNGNKVFHNTIIAGGNTIIANLRAVSFVSDSVDNEVKNNIFISNGNISEVDFFGISGIVLDNNLYFDSTGNYNFTYNNTTYTSLSAYQSATGQDLHSIVSDPLLSGYLLSPTSPAIDAGVDVGVTEDYRGIKRPQGAGFDIGCVEFTTGFQINGVNATGLRFD